METSHDSASDEQALRDLVHAYADAVNRRDAEAWQELWTEDGVWEAFGTAFEGREQVVATWQGAMQGFALVFHVSHHGVLTVEGDVARGRCITTTTAARPVTGASRAGGSRFCTRARRICPEPRPEASPREIPCTDSSWR
jgi:ketosteroid isomerase-like protein